MHSVEEEFFSGEWPKTGIGNGSFDGFGHKFCLGNTNNEANGLLGGEGEDI